MKYQANRNYVSNDVVMTPIPLAERLLKHFKPTGKGLEPCCGCGNILHLLPAGTDWCEISLGKDFFDYNEKVDFIFTNPPWSKFRDFLNHAMEISDEIYVLITINHLWTKARLRDIAAHGFGVKEICLVKTPRNFPQTGFQLGMIHLSRSYKDGGILLTMLEEI